MHSPRVEATIKYGPEPSVRRSFLNEGHLRRPAGASKLSSALGCHHFPFVFRPWIESPNRAAVFRIVAGERCIRLAMACSECVFENAMSSRSSFIDQKRLGLRVITTSRLHLQPEFDQPADRFGACSSVLFSPSFNAAHELVRHANPVEGLRASGGPACPFTFNGY
jgi:hypothetical protein